MHQWLGSREPHDDQVVYGRNGELACRTRVDTVVVNRSEGRGELRADDEMGKEEVMGVMTMTVGRDADVEWRMVDRRSNGGCGSERGWWTKMMILVAEDRPLLSQLKQDKMGRNEEVRWVRWRRCSKTGTSSTTEKMRRTRQ